MECWFDDSTKIPCSGDVSSDIGNFECNICFEVAQDPIVTLCGHLYCWPCVYLWLHIHSHTNECPVCKAVVEEEKLVPIYGRGKTYSMPRSPAIAGVNIPNRPAGQRPPTAPVNFLNYFQQDELRLGESTSASTRFGNFLLSALFGSIPSVNLQVHGFHDATIYGATSGVPPLFSGSFHGSYAHGFPHGLSAGQGPKNIMKLCFFVLGFLAILHLITS